MVGTFALTGTFELHVGDDWSVDLDLKESDGTTPLNLSATGLNIASYQGQIREEPGGAASATITVTERDALNGQITISGLGSELTNSLKRRLEYDVFGITVAGAAIKLLQGRVRLRTSVTELV